MAHPLIRVCRDDVNQEWEVRAVQEDLTERRKRLLPRPELAHGWLWFIYSTEHRPLDPVTSGWYIATDELLTRWSNDASVVTARDDLSRRAHT